MTALHSPKHQAERQVFGFAITQDTTDIFKAVKQRDETRDDSDHLGYTTSNIVKKRFADIHRLGSTAHGSLGANLDDAFIILAAGVRDSYSLLHNVYDANPQLGFEQALAVSRHKETARSIAAIALREQEDVWALMSDYQSDQYRLEPSGLFVQRGDALTIPEAGGCPFAGNEDIVKPDPLFARFIHWVGELGVQYYFDAELKK